MTMDFEEFCRKAEEQGGVEVDRDVKGGVYISSRKKTSSGFPRGKYAYVPAWDAIVNEKGVQYFQENDGECKGEIPELLKEGIRDLYDGKVPLDNKERIGL